MTSVQAAYPNGIFSWTDKIDGQTEDANDVNALASELIAVETVLGSNLQQETNPPVGNPVNYSSVNARITDANNNALMPVSALTATSQAINNVAGGTVNQYTASYDPFAMYNGVDITIPANGWYVVTATQTWAWWNVGYSYHTLTLNGFSNIICDDMISWQFPGNTTTQGIPGRWQRYGNRPLTTKVLWQGPAHKGDRFSCLSENGTTNATQQITGMTLKASMTVSFEGNSNFTSG